MDTLRSSWYCAFHARCCLSSVRFLFLSRWRMDRRSWAQNVKALNRKMLRRKNNIKLAQVKLGLLGNYLAVFSQRLGENIPSRSCKDSMVSCWNLAFFPLNRRRMRSTLSNLSLIASTKLIACLKSRPSESSVPGVSARQRLKNVYSLYCTYNCDARSVSKKFANMDGNI